MSVFNKRNAILGWAVWQVGKQQAKRKARGAVPSRSGDSMRNKGAIAAGLATVGGAVWFLRRRKSDDVPDLPTDSPPTT